MPCACAGSAATTKPPTDEELQAARRYLAVDLAERSSAGLASPVREDPHIREDRSLEPANVGVEFGEVLAEMTEARLEPVTLRVG